MAPTPEMTAPNPDYAEFVRTVVLSMPASRLLGFSFTRLAPGEAEIALPVRPELTQHDGVVAGGFVGALADVAAGSAAGTLLPPGWITMTADYTVKLIAPAAGPTVVARGRVLSPGRSTSVAAADVFCVADDGAETLAATALVTMRNVRMPGD